MRVLRHKHLLRLLCPVSPLQENVQVLKTLHRRCFFGRLDCEAVLNPISGHVFDEGHGESGVLRSAEWHDDEQVLKECKPCYDLAAPGGEIGIELHKLSPLKNINAIIIYNFYKGDMLLFGRKKNIKCYLQKPENAIRSLFRLCVLTVHY
ncbi:hypothetical protein TNCV_862031 [Trichonephila clavipes]|nr:hypothetical protein TNCV_862031 [Trichonephila clavipes]